MTIEKIFTPQDDAFYAVITHAAGPQGALPLTPQMLMESPSGNLFGIPPTGKPINITGTSLLRLQDGRITWQRINNDDLGMMSQLGLFALPENGNGSDGRRA